jgi:DNA-directed RNA polymerase specialized sigma24 family protein
MPVEQLTYAQIAERLGVTSEAARAIVKRHRLPRSRSNDGKDSGRRRPRRGAA